MVIIATTYLRLGFIFRASIRVSTLSGIIVLTYDMHVCRDDLCMEVGSISRDLAAVFTRQRLLDIP